MALSILIADDSALARKILIKSLPADWEIDVTEASNGTQALEHYRAGRAEVMFLDLTMPDMTGYEVLEAMRYDNESHELNTFVIVVSADVQAGALERVRALGAAAFIQKPVTPDKLLPVLREYGLYE